MFKHIIIILIVMLASVSTAFSSDIDDCTSCHAERYEHQQGFAGRVHQFSCNTCHIQIDRQNTGSQVAGHELLLTLDQLNGREGAQEVCESCHPSLY